MNIKVESSATATFIFIYINLDLGKIFYDIFTNSTKMLLFHRLPIKGKRFASKYVRNFAENYGFIFGYY